MGKNMDNKFERNKKRHYRREFTKQKRRVKDNDAETQVANLDVDYQVNIKL